jgi:Cu/Ag efflux protein CusF
VLRRTLAVATVVLAAPLAGWAQTPVTRSEAVEATATVEAIDHTARLVTLKGEGGETETIYCPPAIKRFDELKVGDKVSFRYRESIVYKVSKPGAAPTAPASAGPKLVRGTGPRPGGTVSRQETATVTIKAIDPKVPSVTVLTDDGRTVSFKVEDPKNLKGFKPGDTVEITYTEALMVSVQ